MAKFSTPVLLLAEFFCLGIICGLEWERVPDEFLYACAGSKVTFPWRFKVAEGESVIVVHWIHDGALSSEVVATVAHGQFVAVGDFSTRVQYVQDGGLVLGNIVDGDGGNYTVEVNVEKRGSFHSFRHSVFLQVADGLMVQGGELKAAQDPEARWDESSQQWQIRLTCGAFTFLGPPPVDVTWTTPQADTASSSGYEAGHFFLSLVTPVRGGNYTCTIPPVRLPDVCHREQGRGSPDSRAIITQAAVTVDELKARLSLLEAHQKTLQEDKERLQEKLQDVEKAHAEDVANVTRYCRDMKNSFEGRMEDLQQSLQDQMQKLWNKSHAVDTGPCKKGSYKEIDEPWRLTSEEVNDLQCDNKLEVGWYRFFLNGANAEMPTSCVPKNHCNAHAPQWLDLQGKRLPPVGQETVGRACAHWSSSCCHWESPITVRNCGGFLIYRLQPRSDCHLTYCVQAQD